MMIAWKQGWRTRLEEMGYKLVERTMGGGYSFIKPSLMAQKRELNYPRWHLKVDELQNQGTITTSLHFDFMPSSHDGVFRIGPEATATHDGDKIRRELYRVHRAILGLDS